MLNTSGLTPLLLPDIKRVYIEAGKARPPEYTQFMNVEDLDWQGEKDLQLAGTGLMPSKPEGTPFAAQEAILGGTKAYTSQPYGFALEISAEMWEDDLMGAVMKIVQGMTRGAMDREEIQAHIVLNQAFNTAFSGFRAGEALIQRNHTLLDGTQIHNTPATSQSFGIAYLQGMIQRFHALVGHRDSMPRLMAPRLIIVTPQNLFVAREILGSATKPFTADNEVNSLTQEGFALLVDHFITNQNHHFALAAQGEHDLNFRWRNRRTLDMFDDPRIRGAVATVYQRHTDGTFGDWEGIDGSGN